jgi:preprotein translocase subunit YajC
VNQLGTLLPLVLILAGGYFLLIRPTRKRAQEVDALQKALGVGVEVMLTSGIFGTVRAIVDEKVDVEIAPGVVITVHRGAISKIIAPDELDDGNDPTGSDVEPGVTDNADDTNGADDTDDDSDPDTRGAH